MKLGYGLKLALLALAYALLGWLTLSYLSAPGGRISLVWPSAGLALAALLMGGRRYAPGLWLGNFANGLVFGNPVWVAAAVALGCTAAACLGRWLLTRSHAFGADLHRPGDYLRLAGAGAASATAAAGVGVSVLWLAGSIPAADVLLALLNWWQGDTLGVFLLTPLLLIWRQRPTRWPLTRAEMIELVLLFGLLFLTGQIVFLDWWHSVFGPMARGYLLFVFVAWAAARFGRHGASLAIAVVATQALLGMAGQTEIFGSVWASARMINFWLYTMILSSVGMTLALLINQRQKAQATARISAERLQAMTAAMPGVVYQLVRSAAGDWHYGYVSLGVEKLCGVTAQQACHNPDVLTALIVPEDRAGHWDSIEHSAQHLSVWEHEYRITTPSGQLKWVQGRATPEPQPDGSIQWSGMLIDITQQHQAQAALRLAASVFEHTQESIVITDAEHNIIDANQAFTRANGYSRAEVLGRNPRLLKSGHQSADFYRTLWLVVNARGFWTGEVWNRHKSGEVYAALLSISAVKDANAQVTHYVGVSAEITLLKARQQQMERIAHFDALTGIPNRLLLADRLTQAMAQTRRNQELLAVCYLDLDGFKSINDSHGHDAGDAVLIEVVQRINNTIRAGDTVARIGGDEFVILLPGLRLAHEYEALLDRLLLEIAQPLMPADHARCLGASVGVSLFPLQGSDADALLHQADQAMYCAKRAGKSCYRLYAASGCPGLKVN